MYPKLRKQSFRIHVSARMSAVNLSRKSFASPSRRLHSSAPREGRGNCDKGIYYGLLMDICM